MNQNEAEKIVISAFNSILEKLRTQKEYDPKILIEDIYKLAKTLNSGSLVNLSFHTRDDSCELEYKAIAEESLNSYAQTKESVERITNEQCKLIEDSKQKNILHIDQIMSCFSNIHTQLESQMFNANETIKALHQQVSILEKTSNIDPLTGVLNRRALDTYLNAICTTGNKHSDTHIMLIDIDNFKVVNDGYGHLAGDRVLVFLAKLVNNLLREGDKLFRYGGEEFLVVLNRSNELACTKVAERIIKSVRANTLFYKEHKIKITLSIGATKLAEADTVDSFVDRADRALYQAKGNGKDQLVVN